MKLNPKEILFGDDTEKKPVLLAVTPPRAGERTLLGVENMLGSIAVPEPFSLELAGDMDGVTLMARCLDDEVVRGQLSAHYPQARIQRVDPDDDPLRMGEGEQAWSMTLRADAPEYVPLRTFRDDDLLDPGSDPLIALMGALSNINKGERIVARLMLRSLGPDWSQGHLDKAHKRPGMEPREPAYTFQTKPLQMDGITMAVLGLGALVGASLLNLVDSVIREQESVSLGQRRGALVVVDEMQSMPGVDYESMLSELGKFGASFVLATQSLAKLDDLSRTMRDTLLANVGCLAVFQVAGSDARQLVWELGKERVTEDDITSLPVHHCYVRATVGIERMPAFSMMVRKPEEGDPAVAAQIRSAASAYTLTAQDLEDAGSANQKKVRDFKDRAADLEKDGGETEEKREDKASKDPNTTEEEEAEQ